MNHKMSQKKTGKNISYALREKCVVLSACILQIINGQGIW